MARVHWLGGALLALASNMMAQQPQPIPAPGLWFVYRHPEVAPWGRRVVHLQDAGILEFFQRLWREGPRDERAYDWVTGQLGGKVYGFSSLLEAIGVEDLAAPQSLGELLALLQRHLYVEGDPAECVRMDLHSLRVKTDDDDYDLTYGFFDDVCAREHGAELAFLLHHGNTLPDGAAAASTFPAPDDLRRLLPAGHGEGCTFAYRVPINCSSWLIDLPTLPATSVFPGVRLPELAAHLRAVQPQPSAVTWHGADGDVTRMEPWPKPWLALRALLGPEEGLDGALSRLQCVPSGYEYAFMVAAVQQHVPFEASHAEVHAAVTALLAELAKEAPATQNPVAMPGADLGAHHAVAFLGYDQGPLILFDDLWASAHPDLAQSMLQSSRGWDPLATSYEAALRRMVVVSDSRAHSPPGQHRLVADFALPQATAMCVDGASCWLVAGETLYRLELPGGTPQKVVSLPFPVAGLAFAAGRLHLLDAARRSDGCAVVHRLKHDASGLDLAFAVPLVERDGEASAPCGLATDAAGWFLLQSNGIVQCLDENTALQRCVVTGLHDAHGLACLGTSLVTCASNTLVQVLVSARRASLRCMPLPATPAAVAVDAEGHWYLLPSETRPDQLSLRRFDEEPQREIVITCTATFADGTDELDRLLGKGARLSWTVAGERVDDAATLQQHLRALLPPPEQQQRDSADRPLPPLLRVLSAGDLVPVSCLSTTLEIGRRAGFVDVEMGPRRE